MAKGLTYGNVRLRAPEPEDIDLLYEWENDVGLWKLSNTRVPFSQFVLARYLEESKRDLFENRQVRLIIENREGRPVGAADLYDIDLFHQRAGVGILIYREEDRRQGYASDTLHILDHYALEVVGLRQLFASIAEDNTPSIDLFQKAGYDLTGIRKKWLNTLKGWKDEWFFQKILTSPLWGK